MLTDKQMATLSQKERVLFLFGTEDVSEEQWHIAVAGGHRAYWFCQMVFYASEMQFAKTENEILTIKEKLDDAHRRAIGHCDDKTHAA